MKNFIVTILNGILALLRATLVVTNFWIAYKLCTFIVDAAGFEVLLWFAGVLLFAFLGGFWLWVLGIEYRMCKENI